MSNGNFYPLGNAAAGSRFEVYPEALRAATDDVYAARETVVKFGIDDLSPMVLRDDDVGLLGVQSDVVTAFNDAIAGIRDKTGKGAVQLERFAQALDKAADYYETQDEEDFKQLRAKEEGVN
ncbi:hypothetical protein QRX50_36915 [Amycolatopsis carbonis]|uniref:Uncharacterized protein n=1 Tax=Amycolatopsis carbonis TaxID=715471 RepID=A0A9Y2MSS1_9PSEU|nr:hypothetical protein [Amycolatopsis sp. 2-15]WIX76961.1 hypothetical protein QRX50_36915 [Amycolatopsis sp. 2-15]